MNYVSNTKRNTTYRYNAWANVEIFIVYGGGTHRLSEDSAVVPGNIPGHLFVSPLHAISSRILESFQDSEVNVPISYHQFWVIWH